MRIPGWTSRTGWGIDVSSMGLRALKLAKSRDGKRLRLLAVDHLVFPDAMDDVPSRHDKLLREFSQRHGIRNDVAWVSVPARQCRVGCVATPPIRRRQISALIDFEAKQPLSFWAKTAFWDFHCFDDGGGVRPRHVALFLAKRTFVQGLRGMLTASNLRVDGFQSPSAAIYNALVRDGLLPSARMTSSTSESMPSTAVLLLDSRECVLVFASPNGIWDAAFSVAEGGSDVEKVLAELTKQTKCYRNTHRHNSVRACLVGINAPAESIYRDWVCQHVTADCRRIQLPPGLEVVSDQALLASTGFADFYVAYGMALRAIGVAEIKADLSGTRMRNT